MPTGSPHASISSPQSFGGSGGRVGGGGSVSGEQLSETNLYVRGLLPDTTDKDLVQLCQQYGKIISTKAIIDQTTGKCKGYGFVDYETAEAASAAVKGLTSTGVQAQMAKQQEQDSTNLYIANLPPHIGEAELEALFAQHGPVISTRILRDTNGNSRGVGFARMETKDKCEAVIQEFNGTHIQGCKEPITAKFADGGNKKKLLSHNRQWADRSLESLSYSPYDHITFSPNGLAPGLVSPLCNGFPRYAVATSSLNNFHVPSSAGSWIPYPCFTVLPTSIHPGGALLDPSVLPQLSAQMNHLQLSPQSYLPTGTTTFIQMPYPPTATLQPVNVENMY